MLWHPHNLSVVFGRREKYSSDSFLSNVEGIVDIRGYAFINMFLSSNCEVWYPKILPKTEVSFHTPGSQTFPATDITADFKTIVLGFWEAEVYWCKDCFGSLMDLYERLQVPLMAPKSRGRGYIKDIIAIANYESATIKSQIACIVRSGGSKLFSLCRCCTAKWFKQQPKECMYLKLKLSAPAT